LLTRGRVFLESKVYGHSYVVSGFLYLVFVIGIFNNKKGRQLASLQRLTNVKNY
jgi:hypothetical protein